MNIHSEYQRPSPTATLIAQDDETLVILTHLYLELQLPPAAAVRAAQADHPAWESARTLCSATGGPR